MNTQAIRRIKKAQRRLAILKREVRWWGEATPKEKLCVLGEVRSAWLHDTYLGAWECNAYHSASDYLDAQTFYRRRAV